MPWAKVISSPYPYNRRGIGLSNCLASVAESSLISMICCICVCVVRCVLAVFAQPVLVLCADSLWYNDGCWIGSRMYNERWIDVYAIETARCPRTLRLSQPTALFIHHRGEPQCGTLNQSLATAVCSAFKLTDSLPCNWTWIAMKRPYAPHG